MIETEAQALALLKRTEHRLGAAAWLAKAMGFTSRTAVLCSLRKPPGWREATTIMETAADGGRTWLVLIEQDALAAAVGLHLERRGAPIFLTHEAHAASVAALERALRAGSSPVPARAAALYAVGHAAPGTGQRPGQAQGRDLP